MYRQEKAEENRNKTNRKRQLCTLKTRPLKRVKTSGAVSLEAQTGLCANLAVNKNRWFLGRSGAMVWQCGDVEYIPYFGLVSLAGSAFPLQGSPETEHFVGLERAGWSRDGRGAHSQQRRQQSANSGGTKEENPQLVCGHRQSKLLSSWKSLGDILETLTEMCSSHLVRKLCLSTELGVVKRAWWKRQPWKQTELQTYSSSHTGIHYQRPAFLTEFRCASWIAGWRQSYVDIGRTSKSQAKIKQRN